MSPMTIMDSLARERERAAREGQRIVDAKKAHFVTEQRRGMLSLGIQLLPNLAIRRPPRSASSPRSELHRDRARSDRLKSSSIKNAQAWLNRAKAKTQATGDANGSASATKDTVTGGTNGASDTTSKSGRPSTLADFVAASRNNAGSSMSTHPDAPGISLKSGASWGSAKVPFSTENGVNPAGAASSTTVDRDATPDTTRKRPRFTRSTAGCLGCRKQKVRCDESKPACLKCIAAERECIWPPEGGRKRRKRGTVGMGSSKDKGESYALSQIKTECAGGQDRSGDEGGHVDHGGVKGKSKDRSESESLSASASGSGSFGLGIKPKTSMARQISGLGAGSSGSGGSSDDDKDEDDEDEGQSGGSAFGNANTAVSRVFQTPIHGQDGFRSTNTSSNNPPLDPLLTGSHIHPSAALSDPTSSFNLSSTDWDFKNHLHSFSGDTVHSHADVDGAVQTVLDMGLNSAAGSTSTHGALVGGGNNGYTRSQSLGHGPNSGANEILGPHSMPTPNMPTPSSVHSQNGMGIGGSSIGMGMSGSQSHIPFMTDSPILSSPTTSTNFHSLVHPSNVGVSNPHLHTSSHTTSGAATVPNTSTIGVYDYSAPGRQGTVSPSQLLLPRTSAGGPSGITSGPSMGSSGSNTIPLGGGATINVPASALSPPQLIDLSKSTLLAKRKDKAKFGGAANTVQDAGSGQLMDVSPASLRMAMVEMILHFDEGLFEFGPSHRTRNLLNTLTTPINTDFLSLAFPSPAARLLFHHYCNVTSRLLITMGNVGPNPLLALCTPLKLLDTASAWAGAIRMSILSISATHFAHETEASVGKEILGEEWDGKRVRLKELSRKFKKAALCNVYLGTGGDDPQQIDSILAACTLLCIRDVIDADETWQDNLEFALHMISKRGGPLAMLKAADTSFTRRYLLENLAVHDVFGCFITGKEPSLLGNYDPWWFDSVDSSTTRWEWESVEQTFGISRTVVDLLARGYPFEDVQLMYQIAALDSRKRRLEINLARNPEEMNDVGQYIYRECQNLLFELDILGNSLSALPQHVRVTCGDYIYKYTAAVYVLADILEEPPSTPRIVRDVASILELCSEASAMRMSVMLIWPLLIAGTFCLPDVRPKVEELFDVFEPYYAEDLPAARLLLREQWKGMDEGKGKRSWREVMRAANKFVLLI